MRRARRRLPLPGPHRDTLIAIGVMMAALAALAISMILRGANGG